MSAAGTNVREIVLDTETTGFEPDEGHRLVEIGCLELINHVPTGETFHVYINPERDMPAGAFGVHGLSEEFLSDKPKFTEVADDFIAFIGSDPLVIHNASFDMKFLNAELRWLGKPQLQMAQAVDTLELARRKFPGQRNSLDALCSRFSIDNSSRTLHGALLDSELLAEVYLELIGGRQVGFDLSAESAASTTQTSNINAQSLRPLSGQARPVRPHPVSPDELAAHKEFLGKITEPLWSKFKV